MAWWPWTPGDSVNTYGLNSGRFAKERCWVGFFFFFTGTLLRRERADGWSPGGHQPGLPAPVPVALCPGPWASSLPLQTAQAAGGWPRGSTWAVHYVGRVRFIHFLLTFLFRGQGSPPREYRSKPSPSRGKSEPARHSGWRPGALPWRRLCAAAGPFGHGSCKVCANARKVLLHCL